MKEKVLVTGGAGFIGSHIVDLLVRKEYNVIIADNLSTGMKENINPRTKFYLEDLRNHEKIKEIFEKEKPEIVYHFAAHIDVRKSVENPVFDAHINILSTLNLLELSVRHNVKHFIFSSTGGAIYGDAEIPAKEETPEFPISPYGCSKLAIEKYLNFYNKVYGLKSTILRYSNVYGPRQNPKAEEGVVAILFDSMLNGKNPVIFGGLQTRDFVYVDDVARANLLVLEDTKFEVYNVGTGKETDIISLFEKINKIFSNKFGVEYAEKRKGEQNRSCLNYEKIKKQVGWEPLIELEAGLRNSHLWYLRHKKRFNKNNETIN